MIEQEPLINLLIACTVRVETPNAHGTGFFVAPGLILTCAHVIQRAVADREPIAVFCSDNHAKYTVQEIRQILSDPYPDLALLRIDRLEHPCVCFDAELNVWARLYTYGYSRTYKDGDPLTLEYEGMQGIEQPLLKLKGGQVEPGFSGSPLLNEQSGGICGMLKRTRGEDSDLGGRAIPTRVILAQLPELAQLNQAFHQIDARWTNARAQPSRLTNAAPVTSAALWCTEGDVPPQTLLGRDQLIDEIRQRLDTTKRVLLVGLGGMGKTVLALHIVHQYLASQRGRVIWLQADAGQTNMLIEALADCLGRKPTIVSQAGIAQITALRQLLNQSNIELIVIDDARIGAALRDILQSIPGDLPVLVTSRQRMGTIPFIEVDELSPEDSLKLLEHYAGQTLASDPDAPRLCKLLGHHPYALELAGTTLKVNSQTPGELCQVLAESPYTLSAPGGYAPVGHESLNVLLDQSVNALDEATRKVFMAFGAFSTSGVTVDLLALYLACKMKEVQQLLGELISRSLVKRRFPTNFYYLHDLTFSYAQGRFKADTCDPQQITTVIEEYVSAHAQDYEQLGLNLSNILGVAAIASNDVLVRIMSWITVGGYPTPQGRSYFDERGHTLAFLEKLDQSIEAATRINSISKETLHYLLTKRGNAYFDRRDMNGALQAYQVAKALAPSVNRTAKLLALIGTTYAEQSDEVNAHTYLSEAYDLAKSNHDDDSLSFVLEHRSLRAGRSGDFEGARRFAAEEVEINKRLADPIALGFSLLNLGSAERDVGHIEQARSIHHEALGIARREGHLQLTADILHAIADDYHKLGAREQARTYFEEALELCQQTGDAEHEAAIFSFLKTNGYRILEQGAYHDYP